MTHKGTPQLDALTGLRGVAAWLVVAFHFREALQPFVARPLFAIADNGALAVDLFFVMSGFIIALNYRRDFTRVRFAACRTFLLLRIARIYPLHIFMLALFLAYFGAASIMHGGAAIARPGYFLQSIVLVQAWIPGNGLAWNVPAWSISTEMFAYLLFPFLAAAASRMVSRGPVVCVLLVILAALAALAPYFGGLTDISHFGLMRCVLEFAAGVCVHRLWELKQLGARGAAAAQAAGLALLASLAMGVPAAIVVPAAFCCLVSGLAVPGTIVSAFLAGGIPQFLGTVSYATYLCHYLIKYIVKLALDRPGVPVAALFPIYAVLVLLASWPLYRFVEVPGRRAIRRLTEARPVRV